MKKVTRNIFLIALLVMMSAFSITAHAEPDVEEVKVNLDYQILVYDRFKFYISESENETGKLIADGGVERGICKGSTTLDPGKTYYLHIAADIQGMSPGFAGKFVLNDNQLKFSNNSNELLTNPTDFRVWHDGFGKDAGRLEYKGGYTKKLPTICSFSKSAYTNLFFHYHYTKSTVTVDPSYWNSEWRRCYMELHFRCNQL